MKHSPVTMKDMKRNLTKAHRKKQAGDNQILTFAPKHMHSNVTEQDQLLSSTVEKHDIHMLMCFNPRSAGKKLHGWC